MPVWLMFGLTVRNRKADSSDSIRLSRLAAAPTLSCRSLLRAGEA